MTRQQFLDAFKKALTDENVPESFISEQIALLEGKIESLSDEEFEKRANDENITMLSRSALDEYLSRTRHSGAPVQEEAPTEEPAEPEAIETVVEPEIDVSDEATKKIESVPEAEDAVIDQTSAKTDADDDIVTVDMTPVASNTKKKEDTGKPSFFATLVKKAENKTPLLIFTILTVLSIPLLLVGALLSLGALASLYFVLAALVIGIVAAIIIIVLGGGVTSLIALLYGATQIMQEPRYVGIHEIGFALIVCGATILISVLLYNVAVRLIPWVLSKAAFIFKYLVSGVKKLAEKAKKGCEKL